MDEDRAYQLKRELDADWLDEHPGIIRALGMWSGYHADVPFDGTTGDAALDLRLADAFRMLIFLRDAPKQMAWIERETKDRTVPLGRYESRLLRWWLDIFDDAKTKGII